MLIIEIFSKVRVLFIFYCLHLQNDELLGVGKGCREFDREWCYWMLCGQMFRFLTKLYYYYYSYYCSRTSVVRTLNIQTLQITEHPRSNSSMCRHEELLDHTPSLVYVICFPWCSVFEHFSYPNTSRSQCVSEVLLYNYWWASKVSETLYRGNKLRIGDICLFIYVCGRTYVRHFVFLLWWSTHPHTLLNRIFWIIDLYPYHQLLPLWIRLCLTYLNFCARD